MRILLIEDDADLAAGAYDYLEADGFLMDSALDGVTGLHLATTQRYEAIILDLRLPRLDGIELCQKLRREVRCGTPIIMVTARDTLKDKLLGFEAGADDYLVKPFSLQELSARLQALGRRGQRCVTARYRIADLSLDLDTREVFRADRRIELTRTGIHLLEMLMRHSPAVVPRNDLEQHLWGGEIPDSDVLRAHIHSLRAQIDKPFTRKLLHTLHGVGYRLADLDAGDAGDAEDAGDAG